MIGVGGWKVLSYDYVIFWLLFTQSNPYQDETILTHLYISSMSYSVLMVQMKKFICCISELTEIAMWLWLNTLWYSPFGQIVVMVHVGRRRAFAVPLNEVGVMYSYGEALFPDVDGLQHPSMPQLTWHIVYVEDPGKLTEDTWDTVDGRTPTPDVTIVVIISVKCRALPWRSLASGNGQKWFCI